MVAFGNILLTAPFLLSLLQIIKEIKGHAVEIRTRTRIQFAVRPCALSTGKKGLFKSANALFSSCSLSPLSCKDDRQNLHPLRFYLNFYFWSKMLQKFRR
jgi:hypothetical protein